MFKVTFLIAVIGLLVFAMQTRAEVFTVEMVTDIESDQVYFFEPNNLVVQPGDTVTFVNLQEDFHNVVFERVPEGVDTIESPMLENASDHITGKMGSYDELSVHLKQVHNTDKGNPVNEIIVNLIKGTPIAHAKVEDRDILIGMDKALSTIKNTVVHT